jgi:hypothetical protein
MMVVQVWDSLIKGVIVMNQVMFCGPHFYVCGNIVETNGEKF